MFGVLVGMAIGYIAFTENGHKLGNMVAQAAVSEGKKLMEGQAKKEQKKEEKKDEA